MNVPQLATSSDGVKFGFTGYSPLASAYIFCAVSPDNHSINFNALSLFGAAFVIATPETFICVPPLLNFGKTIRTLLAHSICSGFANIFAM